MELRSVLDKTVKITVEAGNGVFYYRGKVVGGGKDYILIKDIKSGYIHIVLDKVITIQEVEEDGL